MAGYSFTVLVVTSNKAKQLLVLTYVGHVRLEELVKERDNIKALATELSSGLKVLADYSRMDAIDRDCTSEIGRMMEWLTGLAWGWSCGSFQSRAKTWA